MRAATMFAAVFVGGALGSLLRGLLPAVQVPGGWLTGSFAVNALACFAIGVLFAVRPAVHERVMHLGAVGFCGGLSTFSAFAEDVARMLGAREWAQAAIAPLAEIGVGIAAAVLGEIVGRRWLVRSGREPAKEPSDRPDDGSDDGSA